MKYFILIILLFSKVNFTNHIRAYTFKQTPYNRVTSFIGDQPIQVLTQVDLTQPNSCFILNAFTVYNSSKAIIINNTKEINLNQQSFIAKEIEDLFSFDEDTINETNVTLKFDILLNEPTQYHLNRVSLPFTFKDESYSIIHQYKHKKLIDHLSFSRVILQYITIIHLGGIPNEYITNLTESSCDVYGIDGRWDCSLSKIILRNNTQFLQYDIKNTIVSFDLGTVFLYVPMNFFDYIVGNFFVNNIKERNCFIEDDDSTRSISCKIDKNIKMGKIAFVIGQYLHEVEIENLIQCSNEKCSLHIIHKYDNKNKWIFGSDFTDLYQTLFDYEAKKIFFYSIKDVQLYKDNNNTSKFDRLIKTISMFNSIMMLFEIGMLFFLKKFLI